MRGRRVRSGRDIDAASPARLPAPNSSSSREPTLPLGTTYFYIQQLSDPSLTVDQVKQIMESFDDLTWDASARSQFVFAMILACGRIQNPFSDLRIFSYFFPPKLTQSSILCLKFFANLLKTYSEFFNIFKREYHGSLLNMRLHLHVKEENNETALDFIRFLVQHAPFSNYLKYIPDTAAQAIVTKYLHQIDGKKRKRAADDLIDNSNSKRAKVSEEVDEIDGSYGTPVWYWADDGVGGMTIWTKYPDTTCAELERAYQQGELTCNVDNQRYVDFKNMLQRRLDDPEKVRKVKREVNQQAENEEQSE